MLPNDCIGIVMLPNDCIGIVMLSYDRIGNQNDASANGAGGDAMPAQMNQSDAGREATLAPVGGSVRPEEHTAVCAAVLEVMVHDLASFSANTQLQFCSLVLRCTAIPSIPSPPLITNKQTNTACDVILTQSIPRVLAGGGYSWAAAEGGEEGRDMGMGGDTSKVQTSCLPYPPRRLFAAQCIFNL
eukprot:1196371-Prorocentrum_minimum.AAC.1